MKAAELVNSTCEPAFALTLRGEIVGWNGPAERSFGRRRSEVLGRRCWDVIAGRDLFGNRYCGPGCPLIGMARRREAVHRGELVVQTASGEWSQIAFCTLLVPGADPREAALVHQLCGQRAIQDPEPAAAGVPVLSGVAGMPPTHSKARPRLTARERELLGYLAEGKTTKELAELLHVSQSTVRSHIRHILRKLGVHSRLEAVALGRRLGLI